MKAVPDTFNCLIIEVDACHSLRWQAALPGVKVLSGFEDSLLSTLKISACHLPLFSLPPVSQPLLSLSPFFTCARLEILAFIPSRTAFKIFLSFTFSLFLFCFPFLNFLSCFDVPLLPLLLSANSFLLPFPSFQTWHPLKFLSSQQCSVPYLATLYSISMQSRSYPTTILPTPSSPETASFKSAADFPLAGFNYSCSGLSEGILRHWEFAILPDGSYL